MAQRTNTYNFLYLQYGDKWYPGFDYENMQTVENQFEYLYKFIGPGVGIGWTLEKLSSSRSDQLSLLSDYLSDIYSDNGKKLTSLGFDFSNDVVCAAGTTNNITLSGGAPNSVDGVSLSANDKVLVKNQTNKVQNGIYSVSSLGTGSNGTWTRSSSMASNSAIGSTLLAYVQAGFTNTSTLWIGSSLGLTVGVSDLYFNNAFEQCVKVYPGSGIVDIYNAKTEYPEYFRYIYSKDYYVWAEPSLNITYNNIPKISSPIKPDINYASTNKATYLATVTSALGSTLYNYPIVSEINYESYRQDLNDIAGEFQIALNQSFVNHKHLGEVNTPSQIDLSADTILFGSKEYNSTSKKSTSVFIIKNSDATLFTGNFDNYGLPKVYVDQYLLPSSEYKFVLDSTPCKLYLKNSVNENSIVQIVLSNFKQKELYAIDSTGYLVGTALTSNGFVRLSDKVLEDRTPTDANTNLVYRNFVWSDAFYQTPKLYLADEIVNQKYYNLNSSSGTLSFESSLPNISTFNYSDLKIVIEEIGREFSNTLDLNNTYDINAGSFTKGLLSSDLIDNFSHNYSAKYKVPATFTFNKYLLSGSGNSDFYIDNTASELQFNNNTYTLRSSSNFGSNNYLVASELGLLTTDESLLNVKFLNTWTEDYGRPEIIEDDYFHGENTNYFKTTYVLTVEGKILKTSDNGNTWSYLKLPQNNQFEDLFINHFDISTDRTQIDVNSFLYHTHVYLATNTGTFYALIPEGAGDDDWDWQPTTAYFDTTTSIGNVTNINDVLEISVKRVDITPGEDDLITYDRILYVASSDDIYNGLYVGDRNQLERITDGDIKGLYWIQDDKNQYNNNLIWWDDYTVYHTHSAVYTEDANGSRWSLPLVDNDEYFTNVLAGTTSNITLSGEQEVDGVLLVTGDRVLVKDQTNKTQNGIYVVSTSAWTRAADFSSSANFSSYKKVLITGGSINSNSTWFLTQNNSFVLGTSDVVWDIFIFVLYETQSTIYSPARPVIKSVIQRKSDLGLDQYLIAHNEGVVLVTDGVPPVVQTLDYNFLLQGNINDIASFTSGDAEGTLIASTTRGVYKSTPLLWDRTLNLTSISVYDNAWQRLNNLVLSTDTIKIINSNTNLAVDDFEFYPEYQLIRFNSTPEVGQNYLYERSFTDFYIDPWKNSFLDDNGNELKVRIVVYVNDKPTTIPYITDSTLGLIRFVSSIDAKYYQNVKVTISYNNPFISNVGDRTHNEIFMGAKEKSVVARLALSNAPNENIIYLNQTVENNLKVVMLDDGTNKEICYIDYVDNYKNPVELRLKFTRSQSGSSYTFPISSSLIKIEDGLSSNIQDDLYYLNSKTKYNIGSLNNANTQYLSLSLKNQIPSLYNSSTVASIAQSDYRGLKNELLITNFISDNKFDSLNSSQNERIELLPSSLDSDAEVLVVYDVENLNKEGTDTLALTNQGLWKYNSYRWIKIKDLGTQTSSFVKRKNNSTYIVGTANGIYEADSSLSFSKNNYYDLGFNDFAEGTWGTSEFYAFAKSDGIVFVKNPSAADFVSEYISTFDNTNVRSLYKTQSTTINNGTSETLDLLFVTNDNGVYVIGEGNSTDIFSTSLQARQILTGISGVNKYFKVFIPYQTPSIPINNNIPDYMFILTDNGLLKTKNWKLTGPNKDKNLLVTTSFLQGYQCYSYYLETESSIDNIKPGKSKIFIGTDKGVFRSLDGGISFEPTNTFAFSNLPVFSLKSFTSTYTSGASSVSKECLVACTSNGLWYTVDNGDNWYKCGDITENSEYPVLFSSYPENNVKFSNNDTTNYLAQSFTTKNSTTLIDKVSAYLTINTKLKKEAYYNTSLANNTVTAYLCSLDGSNLPDLTSILATSSTTLYLDKLLTNTFTTFNFNYSASSSSSIALVIVENVTASGISLLQWKKSNLTNSYSGGKAFSRYSGTWTKLDNSDNNDFYFKVHYSALSSATETIVPVGNYDGSSIGWSLGKSKGVLSDDNGNLKSDLRFLVSLIIDDTYSMTKSFEQTDYITQISNFLSSIFTNTNKTVSSNTVQLSGVDLWKLNSTYSNPTGGFVNSYNTISQLLDNFKRRGNSSDLFNALDKASSGMYQKSVNDMFVKSGEETQNITNTESIKNYLVSVSSLKLSSLISNYNSLETTDDWDNTANNIPSSTLARDLMLDDFANSYIPITICLTDGQRSETANTSSILDYINNFWDGEGYKFFVFGTSRSDYQSKLIQLSTASGGNYFQIENSSDWTSALSSLTYGGSNNLYKGSWHREFYYDQPTYIKNVHAEFVTPTGILANSSCQVEFRYSTSYNNFTSWISLLSGVDYYLKKKISQIEYRVTLTQGYDIVAPVNPYVSKLYHTEVTPAISYLYSNGISTDGFINEYILSSDESSYPELALSFGICRGNSYNWSDYEILLKNRNSILTERQKIFLNTSQNTYTDLSVISLDTYFIEYQILRNGVEFKWDSNYSAEVKVNDIVVNSSTYRIDNLTGLLIFDTSRNSTDTISVTVTELSNYYNSYGEKTITQDNRVYFAENGSWTDDERIVILVNDSIVRGNYSLDKKNGCVIFDNYLLESDIVTIFVNHPAQYKIGIKVEDYNSSSSRTYDFALSYTTKQNLNKLAEYKTTFPSYISDNKILLKSTLQSDSNSISTKYPVYVDYKFLSDQNTKENNTNIYWYLKKTTNFNLISSPNYSNRKIMRSVDLNEAGATFQNGNELYVEVVPKDDFKSGLVYTSEIYTFTNYDKPYASDVKIKSSALQTDNTVASSSILTAYYSFTDPNSATDASIVKWYDWSQSSLLPIYTGVTLPTSVVTSGRILSFTVTPYNSTIYGDPVDSQYVYVV